MFINVKYKEGENTKIIHQAIDHTPSFDEVVTMMYGLKEIVKSKGVDIVVLDYVLTEMPLDKNLIK